MKIDTTENWYVFCIALVNPKANTVEKAFHIYNYGKINRRTLFTTKDKEDIIKMNKYLSLKEISDIYGSTASNICHMIKKYIKKQEGEYARG